MAYGLMSAKAFLPGIPGASMVNGLFSTVELLLWQSGAQRKSGGLSWDSFWISTQGTKS